MHRRAPWLPFTVAIVVLVLHQARLQPWTLDDAYITYRYADNVVAGDGPVFNPGERVEGYTSPLWLALLAGAHALGADLDHAAKALGALCTAAAFALVARARAPGITPAVATVTLLLAGTTGVLSRWALSGMETALVVLVTLVALLLHLHERAGRPGLAPLTGLACAVAVLARPDAGLLFVGLLVDRALLARQGPRALARFALPFLLLAGGFWAARWAWYGWPMPNTFTVKVGLTGAQVLRGMRHLASAGVVGWALGGLLVLCAWRGRLDARNPGLWGALAYVVLHLIYVVAVGGDVFWGWRFFAVVTLPAALLGAVWLDDAARARPALVASGVAAVAVVQVAVVALSPHLNHRGWVARTGLEVGAFLGEHAPEDALLATNIAGSIPYASGLRVLDTLGLNDVHIAHAPVPRMGRGRPGHERGDGAYVLRRAPDYVMFASALGGMRPKFRGDRELARSPAFHERYRYERYDLGDGVRLGLWVRRPEHGGRPLRGVAPVAVFEDVRSADLAEEVVPDDPERTGGSDGPG